MNEKIEELLKKPPGYFVRIGPVIILITLIIGFILLNYSKITQRVYVTGRVDHITHTILPSPGYLQIIIITPSLQRNKILLRSPSALLRVANKPNGTIDVSIRGRVDSFSYKNGLVFFSCDNPGKLIAILIENIPVTIELDQVETSYFEIIRNKF